MDEFPLQSSESEWQYATPVSTAYAAAAVPRITTDPGQYALTSGNVIPPATAAHLPVQTAGRAQPFGEFSGAPYAVSATRQPPPMNYQIGTDTLSFQHNVQPRHGLPLSMPQTSAPSYPSGDYSQQWTPLTMNSRSFSNNYTFDMDPATPYGSTAMSYMQSSGLSFQAGPSEASPVFPGLSPLGSCLPYSGPNRTLPNPTSVQNALHNNYIPTLETDSGLSVLPQRLGEGGIVTSQSSVGSVRQDNGNVSEASSSSTSSPSETHRSSNADYGTLTYSSHFGSNASASSLPSGGIPRRMSNEEGFVTTHPGMQSCHLGTNQLSNLTSSYNMQVMQGGFGIQEGTVNPTATGESASSGQSSSNILHPPQQHAATQAPTVLRSTYDGKSQDSRKPSKSKLKGQKGRGVR